MTDVQSDIRAVRGDDSNQVRELFWEYLQWANSRVNEEFGVTFEIHSMLERDMAHLDVFSPPVGQLILATVGTQAAGVGGVKQLAGSIGEIKRMYVRPQYRGKGLGRDLLNELLVEARRLGYRTIRLDSARFMHEAHALYRSAGFTDISPYPESEIPSEFKQHWVFMEKDLGH